MTSGSTNPRYQAMTLSQLTAEYMRPGVPESEKTDISNEAWRIGNVCSPFFDDADSVARRDRPSAITDWVGPKARARDRGSWAPPRDSEFARRLHMTGNMDAAVLPAIEVPADLAADMEAELRKATGDEPETSTGDAG